MKLSPLFYGIALVSMVSAAAPAARVCAFDPELNIKIKTKELFSYQESVNEYAPEGEPGSFDHFRKELGNQDAIVQELVVATLTEASYGYIENPGIDFSENKDLYNLDDITVSKIAVKGLDKKDLYLVDMGVGGGNSVQYYAESLGIFKGRPVLRLAAFINDGDLITCRDEYFIKKN